MALLDDAAIARALDGSSWRRDGDELVLSHRSRDFAGSMAFVNAVADRAEAADHHPDIDIRWNTVTLRLSTHSEGGITTKDLALASEIEAIAGSGS